MSASASSTVTAPSAATVTLSVNSTPNSVAQRLRPSEKQTLLDLGSPPPPARGVTTPSVGSPLTPSGRDPGTPAHVRDAAKLPNDEKINLSHLYSSVPSANYDKRLENFKKWEKLGYVAHFRADVEGPMIETARRGGSSWPELEIAANSSEKKISEVTESTRKRVDARDKLRSRDFLWLCSKEGLYYFYNDSTPEVEPILAQSLSKDDECIFVASAHRVTPRDEKDRTPVC